ncbi:helix-turn-helix domain-containing protein [Pseudodonghicola flavimaris]|uniref:Helix-turn-helix domain-containing protein n=1 Tax=Pseudodonghicola flavimaris TaxID=3050036 RepID=A0ABT7EW21_9RHOB|nr:helix-turn-helix domain-containing protein [Pseudodonghicola flavimaris]MDK3016531.1 helix-turn-helix domain-containing protein [Pseudodonghicola flavimaris]
MSAIFESQTLGPTERLIMLALADHADDEGRCYPSIARLRQRTGLSERAVQTNLRKLVEQGYVRIVPGGGKGNSNLYFVSANPAVGAPFDGGNPAANAPRRKCTPAAGAPQTPQEMRANPAADAPEPSGTIKGTVTEAADACARGRSGSRTGPSDGPVSVQPAPDMVQRLTHALGFDVAGIVPRYWATPDAIVIVGKWQTDLGLTPEEIIEVAVGNMRAHGAAANGPKVLTRHMQGFAAAKGLHLTPSGQPPRRASPVHLWKLDPEKFNDDGSIRE